MTRREKWVISPFRVLANALKMIHQGFSGEIEVKLPRPCQFSPEGIRRRRSAVLNRLIQRKRKLTTEQMLEIYVLKERGMSNRSIAKRIGVSHTLVNERIKEIAPILKKENLPFLDDDDSEIVKIRF